MEGICERKMLLLSLVGTTAMLLLIPHSYAAVVCQAKITSFVNETKECVCKIAAALDTSVTLAAVGPWGGSGGTAFYDGTASAISAIHLKHGKTIQSLQTQYVIGGTLHWSQTHGGSDGELVTINLNYDEEYISEIKGFYGYGILPCQCPTVNAIEFKVVNTKTGVASTIGPFGTEVGTAFTSSAGGKIVGFYGRAGSTIDQIGVYVQYGATRPHCDTTIPTTS